MFPRRKTAWEVLRGERGEAAVGAGGSHLPRRGDGRRPPQQRLSEGRKAHLSSARPEEPFACRGPLGGREAGQPTSPDPWRPPGWVWPGAAQSALPAATVNSRPRSQPGEFAEAAESLLGSKTGSPRLSAPPPPASKEEEGERAREPCEPPLPPPPARPPRFFGRRSDRGRRGASFLLPGLVPPPPPAPRGLSKHRRAAGEARARRAVKRERRLPPPPAPGLLRDLLSRSRSIFKRLFCALFARRGLQSWRLVASMPAELKQVSGST